MLTPTIGKITGEGHATTMKINMVFVRGQWEMESSLQEGYLGIQNLTAVHVVRNKIKNSGYNDQVYLQEFVLTIPKTARAQQSLSTVKAQKRKLNVENSTSRCIVFGTRN